MPISVNVKLVPSFTDRLPGFVSVGAMLTSFTVIVNDFTSLSAGLPLSVTRTVAK